MPADGTVFRRVVLVELNSSLLSFSRNFDLFNFFSYLFIVIATAEFEMFQNIPAFHFRGACAVSGTSPPLTANAFGLTNFQLVSPKVTN
jgi:hypothetical protein